MLGAAVPLCRSAAFAAAALIASGLATDERLGAARGRWGALADASEVAFDAAREVFDASVGVVALAAAQPPQQEQQLIAVVMLVAVVIMQCSL